jgi:hypothetical protein
MGAINIPVNLQEMFQTINDRLNRLELGYNGPQASADAAQSTAASAATGAAAAQAIAAGAIQRDSYNIFNASNQLTAINGNGITVYAGASPTSGARVVLNSAGLAGVDGSGTTTFSISASTGAISTLGALISGGQISGASIIIGGGLFQVTSGGVLTAQSGTVANWTISGSQLQGYGGTYLDSSSGTIFANGLISTLANMSANGTVTGITGLSGGSLTISGTANMNGLLYNAGHASTTSAANVYMNSGTGLIALVTSSQRYKVEIEAENIPLQSILSLTPKSWVDKVQYENNENSSQGLNRILGVIAEDVAEIPVLSDFLMNKNEQGQPDSVNYDRIAVALLPLLKDHEARLNKLEGK